VIIYALKCDNGHQFEEWFSSGAAYDAEAAAGKLVCPQCNSHKIEKAPMAPAVAKASAAGECPIAQGGPPPCGGACGGCFPE